MFKKIILFLIVFIFVFTGIVPTFALAGEDEEGSEDHPMISRFEGSYIVAYEMYNYDKLELATGMEEGDVKKTTFEGEVTRNVYKGPEGSSSLEVLRNYQIALEEAGFEIVYEDEGKCSDLTPFKIGGYKYGEVACGLGRDSRYLFARLADPDGDILVSVHTAIRGHSPYCLLQVVEEKPMSTGKVEIEIDSEAMKEDIEEGRSVYAQEEEDEEGSEDHPMISRFEGSYIVAYEMYNYDELELATGIEEGDVKKTTFEGEVTRNVYKGPEGSSSLEVLRNYQIALEEAGFEIVYEDEGKCSDLTPFKIGGYKYGEVACGLGRDSRYLFARLADPDGDILVSVHTAIRGHSPYCLLQVVEEKPMSTGKVKVDIDAEAMAEDIEDKGSVRIYGIHFDTDKATIKEKSESTLAEIAALMKEESDLRLGVVGHTDAVGSIEYNMDLSQQRAEAVVEFLASEHGISKDRLKPRGLGPWAPVASNEDEDGRARNRRVELVKMLEQ